MNNSLEIAWLYVNIALWGGDFCTSGNDKNSQLIR